MRIEASRQTRGSGLLLLPLHTGRSERKPGSREGHLCSAFMVPSTEEAETPRGRAVLPGLTTGRQRGGAHFGSTRSEAVFPPGLLRPPPHYQEEGEVGRPWLLSRVLPLWSPGRPCSPRRRWAWLRSCCCLPVSPITHGSCFPATHFFQFTEGSTEVLYVQIPGKPAP